MKVVVTGGSGQLGSVVLERLVADDTFERIVSLDVVPPRVPSPRIDWRIADMRDPGLERHLEGADALVHLAFIVMKAASRDTMQAVNVDATKRLFEASASHGVKRIVYTSSVAAYGLVPDLPEPVVETTRRSRTGFLAYADNKFEVEEYLDGFEVAHPDVAVVRLRPGVLLGRRIAHVSEASLRRRVMPVVGSVRGPIVWDQDVADAVVRALKSDVHGAYNLVAADSLSSEDFARLAGFRLLRIPQLLANAVAKVSSGARFLSKNGTDPNWLAVGGFQMLVNSDKAKRELGWQPEYPTAADVAIAFGKQSRFKTDRRVAVFVSVLPRFARGARDRGPSPPEKLAVHLDVTGPSGADFAITLDGASLSTKRGIPRPSDATVTVGTDTLLELMTGELDATSANRDGKMRVRGEPFAGSLIAGMLDGFRRATRAEGLEGAMARRLSQWFANGSET
jgi:nucleoside-diphosphate-sugar epimerase/putative sterol carrier protein